MTHPHSIPFSNRWDTSLEYGEYNADRRIYEVFAKHLNRDFRSQAADVRFRPAGLSAWLYPSTLGHIVSNFVPRLSDAEQAQVLGQTASEIYTL